MEEDDYLFCVINGKWEKRVSLAAGICGQRTMINEGAKKVFHLLHEQQALSDCSQYRKHSNAKRSTAVSSSELFPGGYAGV